jgi:hypothetical protein
MIGFRVTMSDGSATSVEADRYVVDESGNLRVSGGHADLLRCPAGEWLMVDTIGVRLAAVWPPEDLDDVVASVATLLGLRFGHYVHELGEVQPFQDWRMNDLDALSRSLLAAVGIDADVSSARAQVAEVRAAVAQHFRVDGDEVRQSRR